MGEDNEWDDKNKKKTLEILQYKRVATILDSVKA